jgi:hypothetical protein
MVCLHIYTGKQIRRGRYLEDEELKWDGMQIGKSSGRLPGLTSECVIDTPRNIQPGFLVLSKRKISAANTQVAEPVLSSLPHWYRLEKVAAWNMNRHYLSMLTSLLIVLRSESGQSPASDQRPQRAA